MDAPGNNGLNGTATEEAPQASQDHKSLKYSLLGPSLLKAGQDAVDQRKVCRIVYAMMALFVRSSNANGDIRYPRSYTKSLKDPSSSTMKRTETRFSQRRSNRS